MIRIQITNETRSVDIRTDAPYGPDVLDDLVNRAALLLFADPQLQP